MSEKIWSFSSDEEGKFERSSSGEAFEALAENHLPSSARMKNARPNGRAFFIRRRRRDTNSALILFAIAHKMREWCSLCSHLRSAKASLRRISPPSICYN